MNAFFANWLRLALLQKDLQKDETKRKFQISCHFDWMRTHCLKKHLFYSIIRFGVCVLPQFPFKTLFKSFNFAKVIQFWRFSVYITFFHSLSPMHSFSIVYLCFTLKYWSKDGQKKFCCCIYELFNIAEHQSECWITYTHQNCFWNHKIYEYSTWFDIWSNWCIT